MIYDCIYVEDPIVTHRQCTDGSGNGISYANSSECVTPCDEEYMRHIEENIPQHKLIKMILLSFFVYRYWYSSSTDILFQSLPNTCTNLIYNRLVNITTTNTHERTTNAQSVRSKVGISSPDNVVLSILYTNTCTTCSQHGKSAFVLMDKSAIRREWAFQCAKSKQRWNVVYITVKSIIVSCAILVVLFNHPSHWYGCVSSAVIRLL